VVAFADFGEIAALHTRSRGDIAAPALPNSSVWTRR
jgi:hypothetical protein